MTTLIKVEQLISGWVFPTTPTLPLISIVQVPPGDYHNSQMLEFNSSIPGDYSEHWITTSLLLLPVLP